MSRALSGSARAALYEQTSDEVWLELITIDHDDLASPIRLVGNSEDVTSRGNVFTACGFPPVPLPDDGQDVTFIVENVSQTILTAVRSIVTPIDITLEVVLASDPDTVEAGPFAFQSRKFVFSARTIEFSLAYEPLLQEPFPAFTYTPIDYPGLFNAVDR